MKTAPKHILGALACAILAMTPFSTASGAGFEFLGQHGDWDVFADRTSSANVCYIGSKPVKDEGDYTRRGDIYVLVTSRKSESYKDVVSFHQGYPLKPGRDIKLTIGGASFNLFPSNDTAWTYQDTDDAKIVNLMKRGTTMSVEAQSARGTDTRDTYSLKGITAAYNAMKKACS